MPSKGLKDADFKKPISDEDVIIDNPQISDEDVIIDSAPTVTNETSPDVSWWSRFAVKNFGSPEGGLKYLKEKYPDYNVTNEGGNIFLEKGGKKYPLDPSGFDIADITDIGTDVGSGILSTAATTAGGLAGNVPGAMAAGAASSGTLDALKQGIGNIIGVQEGYDPVSGAISTAAGGLLPAFFGGASAGAVAKEAAKKELTKEASDALLNSQRGILQRGWDSALPFLSRIGKDQIDFLKKNLPRIKALEKNQYPTSELAKKAKAGFETIDEIGQRAGKEGEILRNEFQGSISLDEAKKPILEEIKKIESFDNPTEADKQALSELKGYLENLFPQKKIPAVKEEVSGIVDELGRPVVKAPAVPAKSIPIESVSAPQSFSMRQNMLDVANPMKQYRSGAAENALKRSRQALSQAEKDTVPGLAKHSEDYADIQALNDFLGPKISTEDRALELVKNSAKKGKAYNWELFEKLDKKYGTDLLDTAKLSNVFETFGKSRPGQLLKDAVQQRARAEVIGAGLGGYLGNKSGIGFGAGAGLGAGAGFLMSSPQAVRFYLDMANKAAPASPWMKYSLMPAFNVSKD